MRGYTSNCLGLWLGLGFGSGLGFGLVRFGPQGQVARWLGRLQYHSLKQRHPGRLHNSADALTRRPRRQHGNCPSCTPTGLSQVTVVTRVLRSVKPQVKWEFVRTQKWMHRLKEMFQISTWYFFVCWKSGGNQLLRNFTSMHYAARDV